MQTSARRRNHKDDGLSAFHLLIIGFLSGVFVSVAGYLVAINHMAEKPTPQQAEKRSKGSGATAQGPDLKFEFYSILPELEAVIPEQLTDTLREALAEPASPATSEQGALEAAPGAADTPPQPTETYFLQAGSFRNSADAERMKIKLLLLGLEVDLRPVTVQGNQYHRVRIGPLTDYRSFETARDRLKQNDIPYLVLKSRN